MTNYQDTESGSAELKDYYNQAIKKRRLKRMDKEGVPVEELTDEEKQKLLMEE